MPTADLHSEDFPARTYECAPDGSLRLPQLLNFLQEAASNHAARLGFDFPVIDPTTGARGAWVLAQIRLHLDRLPKWRDTVRVSTFPHDGRGLFALRDYLVTLADGTPCGIGTSRWMIIDPATRRAVRIPPDVTSFQPPRPPLFGADTDPFAKPRYPDDPGPDESHREYRVMRAHIDLNGHVNNVHYVNWMLESVPGDIASSLKLSDLEIVYRSETLYGETVSTRCAPLGDGRFAHRVCTLDGSRDHIVAVSEWRDIPVV